MKTATTQTQLSHSPTPAPVSQTASGPSTNLQSIQPGNPYLSSQPTPPPAPAPQPPQITAAAPDDPDAIKDSRIESLARRQRAHSFLNSLTSEQARQVHTCIHECESIQQAHARITAPLPKGLGLSVSAITLRRLRSHWRALNEVHFTQDMLDIITDMELDSNLTQPARIQNAICHLLQEKAFDLARTVPGSEVMKELLSSIEKLTTLDLKRQKLQLDRERLLRRPAAHTPGQHHRVDLNIVPPHRPSVTVHREPGSEAGSQAGSLDLSDARANNQQTLEK